jgi:hypothetical protein
MGIEKYFQKGVVPFEDEDMYDEYLEILDEAVCGIFYFEEMPTRMDCAEYQDRIVNLMPSYKSLLEYELEEFENPSELFDTIVKFHHSKYYNISSYDDLDGQYGSDWFVLRGDNCIADKLDNEYIENVTLSEYESSTNTYNKDEAIIVKHSFYSVVQYHYEYTKDGILNVVVKLFVYDEEEQNIDQLTEEIKEHLFSQYENINITYDNNEIDPFQTLEELNNDLKQNGYKISFSPLSAKKYNSI